MKTFLSFSLGCFLFCGCADAQIVQLGRTPMDKVMPSFMGNNGNAQAVMNGLCQYSTWNITNAYFYTNHLTYTLDTSVIHLTNFVACPAANGDYFLVVSNDWWRDDRSYEIITPPGYYQQVLDGDHTVSWQFDRGDLQDFVSYIGGYLNPPIVKSDCSPLNFATVTRGGYLSPSSLTNPTVSGYLNLQGSMGMKGTGVAGLDFLPNGGFDFCDVYYGYYLVGSPRSGTTPANLKLDGTFTVANPRGEVGNRIEIKDGLGAVIGFWDSSARIRASLINSTVVPASATATGIAGQFAFDGSYLYLCYAANAWHRIAVNTW